MERRKKESVSRDEMRRKKYRWQSGRQESFSFSWRMRR